MRLTDKRWFKVLCSLIIVSLVIGILPWRELYADSLTYGEYACSPLDVVYEQNTSWDNYTQGQYTVTNNSAYNVTSWSLDITFADDVTVSNIWNVNNETEGPASHITVSGSSAIYSGSTYTFGMIVSGTESAPAAPVSVTLVSIVTDEPEQTPTPTPTDEPTPTEEPSVTPTPVTASEFPYAVFSGSTTTDLTFMC